MSGILFLATFPFLLCSEQPRLCRWAQHAADTLSRKMQGEKSPNVPKTEMHGHQVISRCTGRDHGLVAPGPPKLIGNL